MAMPRRTRPPLLVLALIAVLPLAAACGGEGGDGGSSSDAEEGSAGATGQPVAHELLGIVTQPAAGGTVDTTPTAIDDRLSLLRYAATFRENGRAGGLLADDLVALAEANPAGPGRALAAAVVRVGCLAPEEVDVALVAGEVRVSAPPPPDNVTCVVAETSVAVIDLPADLLPIDPGPTRTADGSGS
ncbi:hypothetical protein [Nocardioides sp. YIM 152588]|uniref:hypothetical protein n=1 Tax=Nocardioides sp. YIM 152588 TaxID=3158259 RepID=UPI0032E46771